MNVRLEELTAPYEARILENQRKELEILSWLLEHPNCHPAEREAQMELCEALAEQNVRLSEQWDEARDRWLRAAPKGPL